MELQSCPGCVQRDAIIADLVRQVAELKAELRELKARLGLNSSNSPLPPSANPPSAPKPVVKKPTGRKPGAQPGHEPHVKQRLSPERITDIIFFVPKQCGGCQAALPEQAGRNDPEPSWHQVVELPALVAEVTEYQGHTRTCPECGLQTHASIPGEIRRHGVGPRLAALLSYLRGAHQVSQRGLEEIVETALNVPLSLGTIAHLEAQTSASLAEAHAEALQAVREASIKHVDETGWKRAGGWLWLAATSTVAAFVIHAQRSEAGLKALLGETITGILCTDRFGVYHGVPAERRQVCWAHLKRDFQKCVDRGGEAAWIGQAGLRVVEEMFAGWHRYRDGPGDRDELGETIAPLSRRLERVLKAVANRILRVKVMQIRPPASCSARRGAPAEFYADATMHWIVPWLSLQVGRIIRSPACGRIPGPGERRQATNGPPPASASVRIYLPRLAITAFTVLLSPTCSTTARV